MSVLLNHIGHIQITTDQPRVHIVADQIDDLLYFIHGDGWLAEIRGWKSPQDQLDKWRQLCEEDGCLEIISDDFYSHYFDIDFDINRIVEIKAAFEFQPGYDGLMARQSEFMK